MKKSDVELKIISIIDRLRPFLVSDGGNIEYIFLSKLYDIKYENNIVYVKLLGACKDCSFIDVTLKDGIEEIIISEIPEVKEVINIDNEEI